MQRTLPSGRSLTYLDSAATTLKPTPVLDVLDDYYRTCGANVHRAFHELSEIATDRFEAARAAVARFIGAPDADTIVFTRGTTESLNTAASILAQAYLGENDRVLLSEMEHHSNLIPWQLASQRYGFAIDFVPVLPNGELDLSTYDTLLTRQPRVVALTQMSNVLGTINPLEDMLNKARDAGAVTVVDGAQSVPHFPVDVQALGCDFLAFSGHKMLGPTGIGVLYGRRELLEELPPFLGGGEMINTVTLDTATWASVPHKFEAGTPPIAGAIGLGAAVSYLESLGIDNVRAHESALTNYTISVLKSIPGIRLFGEAAHRGGVISFIVEGVHPHDVAEFANQAGVALRAGHMCAQPLIRKFDQPAVTRASLYLYNTTDDIDRLAEALGETIQFFA